MRNLTRTIAALVAATALGAPAALAQEGGGIGAPPGSQPPPTPPPPPPPTPKLVVGTPSAKTLIREGQAGRLLIDGAWYFRFDPTRVGTGGRWYRQRDLRGWSQITVPHNWNGADTTLNQQAHGWYRKEFRLPRPPPRRRFQYKLRFEGVNAFASVWLNGRLLGTHSGGYFPFELDARGIRKGRNRLVARVSTFRGRSDLTHWRPFGGGGWWNFGGISREVYLRRIDTVDVEDVAAMPRLRCVRCAASVELRARLRNFSRRGKQVSLLLALSGPRGSGRRTIELPARGLGGGATREVVTRFTIRRPRLWRPGRPSLYSLRVIAGADGARRASYRLAFGVRKLQRRRDGTLLLNGRRLELRGASIHEDDERTGAALTPGQRRAVLRRLRQLGATVARAHYPLHPALLEYMDRTGILYWSQAPIYQLPNALLDSRRVRAKAIEANLETVRHNRNHPSIFVWSLANELAFQVSELGRIGNGYARFVKEGARQVRRLDPSRLVGLDRVSRVGEPFFHPTLRSLDVIGVNEYYGWYEAAAPGYPKSTTADLSPYLDQVHAAYPRQAIIITEFGAESTFSGSERQRGSFEFQRRWLTDHLRIHDSKPYIQGSIIWILKDFRVSPGWTGGNTPQRATPPWNNKGLVDQGGALKPAFSSVASIYRATRPLR